MIWFVLTDNAREVGYGQRRTAWVVELRRVADLRVVKIDIAGVAVSVVSGDGVDGGPMGEVGVLVQGGHDGAVMEAMALDFNGESVHGRSHTFGVADLVGGAIHGGKTKVVGLASRTIVTLDLQMSHGDVTAVALESAATVVNLGVSWGLLIGLSTEATSFLEVLLFASGCAWVLTNVDLGKLDLDTGGNDGYFVDTLVKTMVVGDCGEVVVPNAIGHRGLRRPAVVAGELLNFVRKSERRVWTRIGNPSIVACELLDFIRKCQSGRLGNPPIVACELLDGGCKGEGLGRWNGSPSVLASKRLHIVVKGDMVE